MRRIDLTGKRYERLTVIKEVEQIKTKRRWLCKCDCGNEVIALMDSLRSGNTRSCGCYKSEKISEANLNDLSGKRFGKLVVIERFESRSDLRTSYWLCQCACGNQTAVSSTNLKSGVTRSCGCLKPRRKKTMITKELQKYIDKNLLTKQEAMEITGQGLSAFNQAINTGQLKAFYDHGQDRSRVRLYLKEHVEAYLVSVLDRRKRLEK